MYPPTDYHSIENIQRQRRQRAEQRRRANTAPTVARGNQAATASTPAWRWPELVIDRGLRLLTR